MYHPENPTTSEKHITSGLTGSGLLYPRVAPLRYPLISECLYYYICCLYCLILLVLFLLCIHGSFGFGFILYFCTKILKLVSGVTINEDNWRESIAGTQPPFRLLIKSSHFILHRVEDDRSTERRLLARS